MGVQIIELAIPAINPEAMSYASLGKFSLFVICTNVSKTVNQMAVATPMKRYIEEAPLQNALKNPPLCTINSLRYQRVITLLSCNLVFIRSSGIPVVTSDHPARFPEMNQIATSSMQFTKVRPMKFGQLQIQYRCKYFSFSTIQIQSIFIISMKQNQSILHFVPQAKPQLKHHDFLTLKAHCTCEECARIKETHNPEIRLDNQLYALQRNAQKNKKSCDFVEFLQNLKNSKKNLPKFRFLDTIVVEGGQAAYAIFFEDGKLKIDTQVKLKDWILQRKQSRDIKYQIKKHQRQNNFNFTAFQHECEKKIKQFQNNILYKIPAVLNKTAYIKLKNQPKEILLSKNQFIDLFDSGKSRVFQLKDLEYVQVFPIMYGQEENSYVKTIKYFREKQSLKRSFKLAQAYVSTWKQRNDSLEKMEQKVYEQIKIQENLQELTEQDKLCYQTYKLLIYFEQVTNIRILEAVLQYVTNDNGASYFFKTIDCIKSEKRASVEELGTQLPAKKQIELQDYIDLKKEMRSIFDSFQSQFHRLDKQRQEMQNKVKKDKQYSNFVFKTVSTKRSDNFHEVLLSQKLKYKKGQLNL